MVRTLDLRTGRPVWMAYRAPSVPCTRLGRDARTDVLVVGKGISGTMDGFDVHSLCDGSAVIGDPGCA